MSSVSKILIIVLTGSASYAEKCPLKDSITSSLNALSTNMFKLKERIQKIEDKDSSVTGELSKGLQKLY